MCNPLKPVRHKIHMINFQPIGIRPFICQGHFQYVVLGTRAYAWATYHKMGMP